MNISKTIISVMTVSLLLTSCGAPRTESSTTELSTTVSITDSKPSSESVSEAEITSDINLTETEDNAELEVIKLVAGKRNDYSEELTINKGTEFEEKKIVYFLPKGKYSAKNVSSNIAQFSVYSREMTIVDGWEEPAETIFVKAFKTDEEATFEITGDQYIEINSPDKFDVTVIEYYESVESATENEPTTEETIEETKGWSVKTIPDSNTPYLANTFDGVLNNNDEQAKDIRILVTLEDAYTSSSKDEMGMKIILYIYENDSALFVNKTGEDLLYRVVVTGEKGEPVEVYGIMNDDDSGLWIADLYDVTNNNIKKTFFENEKVKFEITEDSSELYSYSFEMDCTGLEELYNSTEWIR